MHQSLVLTRPFWCLLCFGWNLDVCCRLSILSHLYLKGIMQGWGSSFPFHKVPGHLFYQIKALLFCKNREGWNAVTEKIFEYQNKLLDRHIFLGQVFWEIFPHNCLLKGRNESLIFLQLLISKECVVLPILFPSESIPTYFTNSNTLLLSSHSPSFSPMKALKCYSS